MKAKGHKSVAVISVECAHIATSFRTKCFWNAYKNLKIEIEKSHIIMAENSYARGVLAAEKLLSFKNIPNALFCDSDLQAIGASYVFNEKILKFMMI